MISVFRVEVKQLCYVAVTVVEHANKASSVNPSRNREVLR